MTQHGRTARRHAGSRVQDAFHVQAGGLFAPGAQARRKRSHVGRAVVPVDLGHLDDNLGDDGVQLVVEGKQVMSIGSEGRKFVVVVEIESASKAGKQHPEQEDVGDVVMMADGLFPTGRAGQIDRAHDGGGKIGLHAQVAYLLYAIFIVRALERSDDVQVRSRLRLHSMHCGNIEGGCVAVRLAQRQCAFAIDDDIAACQRSDFTLGMQGGHLLKQRQRQHDHIVSRQCLAGLGPDQDLEALSPGSRGLFHVPAHARPSLNNWRL